MIIRDALKLSRKAEPLVTGGWKAAGLAVEDDRAAKGNHDRRQPYARSFPVQATRMAERNYLGSKGYQVRMEAGYVNENN